MRSLPSLGMLKVWLAIACWAVSLPLLLMTGPAPEAAMNFIAATRPDEEVVIDLVREGQTISISAVVGNKEDATE